jgi:hypothetical protein
MYTLYLCMLHEDMQAGAALLPLYLLLCLLLYCGVDSAAGVRSFLLACTFATEYVL